MGNEKKLLLLDIPSVFDMDTASPVARMKNSAEVRVDGFKAFERAVKNKQRGGKSILSRMFDALSDQKEKLDEPKLLPGAAPFLQEIMKGNSNAWIGAACSEPVLVEGFEYKHTYFDPHFAAFREACPDDVHFMYSRHSSYGLDDKFPKTQQEIDDSLKMLSINNNIQRSDVMVITADTVRAEKSRALGYETVLVENGDYDAAIAEVRPFLATPTAALVAKPAEFTAH